MVDEALTWLNTPYQHKARVKGAGVDCGQLLYAVYTAAGVLPPFAIDDYPRDWHLHRGEERYLGYVQRHAREIDGPAKPGDIVVWRFGRSFAHGAIALAWPRVLHAYVDHCVTIDDAEAFQDLSQRPHRVFDPWQQP